MAEASVPSWNALDTPRRRAGVRSAGWALADQAASSITNFLASFVALRSLTVGEFGAFTVAMLAYQLSLRGVRALTVQPMMVRYGTATPSALATAGAASAGSTLVVGTVLAAAMALAGLGISGSAGTALLSLSPFMPGLLLQDAWRHLFFTQSKPQRAFANDLLWGAFVIIGMAALWADHSISLVPVVVLWGATGTAAGIAGCWQAKMLPAISSTGLWLREHRDLGPSLAAEIMLARGAQQFTLFAIGAIAGLSTLGAVNGARVLFGPINVLYLSGFSFGIAEGARFRSRSPDRFPRVITIAGVALAVVPMVIAVVLVVLPATWGRSLAGGSWLELRALALPIAITVGAQGWTNASRVGLNVTAAGRVAIRAQLIAGPILIACGVVGGLFGAQGAAWGLAVGFCIGTAIFHRGFLRSAGAPSHEQSSGEMEIDRGPHRNA